MGTRAEVAVEKNSEIRAGRRKVEKYGLREIAAWRNSSPWHSF
jgi:hypothetical protein